jgi:hypothetical protein
MSSSNVARCVAVVAFAVAVRSGALADQLSVPLTFDCSVYARITSDDPLAPGEWVQYGTNSTSVVGPHGHLAEISFTSGSSSASLDAHTGGSLSYACRVGALEPSHLIIGTTPELPAGTPLLLTLQTTGSSVMRPSLTLDVNRGTASLIHQTDGDFDQWWVYPTQATATALVVAGETLDIGFYQGIWGVTDVTATFTATDLRGACCLPTGSCSRITQADCTAAAGRWYGASVACAGTGARCPRFCPGDLNCDGRVTYADVDLFVAALGGESAWHRSCPWLDADCNNSGTVTFADIDPFVAVIGTTCPAWP